MCEKKEYILLNGKHVNLHYDGDYDKRTGLVQIIGENTCLTSRRYGTFSDYADMTYDVHAIVRGVEYTIHTNHMMRAEGIAILCAFAKGEKQMRAIMDADADTQLSYAVDFGKSRVLWGEM